MPTLLTAPSFPRPPVDGLRQGQVELVRTLLSVTLGGCDVQGIEKTSVLLFLLGHALNSLSLVAADGKELLEAADFGSIVQLLRLGASHFVSPQPCMFMWFPPYQSTLSTRKVTFCSLQSTREQCQCSWWCSQLPQGLHCPAQRQTG